MLQILLGCLAWLAGSNQKPSEGILKPLLLLSAFVFLSAISLIVAEYLLIYAAFKYLGEIMELSGNMVTLAVGGFFFLQTVVLFSVLICKINRAPNVSTKSGGIGSVISAFVSGFKNTP